MNNWIDSAVFYHIYPLGFCGAPGKNDFQSEPVERLLKILDWIDHFKSLGINALYLGPVFESAEHGYDTVNYFEVDRRLGTNETLKRVVKELHNNGIKVILDAVFNHTGREFFAFKDLQINGESSKYREWFYGLDFTNRSPLGDPFDYQTWDGHYNLVKFNLTNTDTTEHLFEAVKMWVSEFAIDGLRLDAAADLTDNFMQNLSTLTKGLKKDFWLMGEVVHGNYNIWANEKTLQSVTNYECYKGLYSSYNDANMHEIAFALKRQSGTGGIYENIRLYNFLDNHDVDRIASTLHNKTHLFPLHILLFTMPGIPSIYYGSEWGIKGQKGGYNDMDLRPSLDLDTMNRENNDDLKNAISRLSHMRKSNFALKNGSYEELIVEPMSLVFMREANGEKTIVYLNSSDAEQEINHNIPLGNCELYDILNNDLFKCESGNINIKIPANWGRVLILK
ncbi:MAG: alpha-amylase family glycosyl hydrolase [Spirochaetota bacterium]|nr:alpha-amylase family glycosyl hydrolase [Spirochaetota bacterium]